MQEKVIEIIIYIVSELRNNKRISEIDTDKLNSDGYTDAEINSAFTWIFSKIDSGDKLLFEKTGKSKSHRFFHSTEKNILMPEAIGYLIQMKEFGIISELDEELIIDRIFLSGYQQAGKEEIKLVISSLLFDFENKSNPLSRLILQNNDTIH